MEVLVVRVGVGSGVGRLSITILVVPFQPIYAQYPAVTISCSSDPSLHT